MCGFSGELDLARRAADAVAVARMTDTMADRGPDGAGLWAQGPVALGHRRLKVIDLSERAAQPMVDAEAGLLIRADPGWLARALGNLVDNGIQHSPGGATVHLTATARALDGDSDVATVQLTVEDQGVGVPPGIPTSGSARGDSGMGMSIIRTIVDDLELAAGADGRGTVVRMTKRFAAPSG